MTVALRALAGVAALLVVLAVALRWRKLRRDERRRRTRSVDPRLLRPPPSPYQPHQGFRLLDGAEPLARRPTPERPRLDPDHDYVFSDASPEERAAAGRHDSRWALDRATRRVGLSGGARALLVLVVAAALAGGVGYALHRRHPGPPATTTTTVPRVTTTTDWPSVFTPVGGAAGRTYAVPAPSFVLTIVGARGAVPVVVRDGASRAVAYAGTVADGASRSVVVTGQAELTLTAPADAAVAVGGSPVTLPSPLGSTVTLTFTPSG